jgi:hypothetical protein
VPRRSPATCGGRGHRVAGMLGSRPAAQGGKRLTRAWLRAAAWAARAAPSVLCCADLGTRVGEGAGRAPGFVEHATSCHSLHSCCCRGPAGRTHQLDEAAPGRLDIPAMCGAGRVMMGVFKCSS